MLLRFLKRSLYVCLVVLQGVDKLEPHTIWAFHLHQFLGIDDRSLPVAQECLEVLTLLAGGFCFLKQSPNVLQAGLRIRVKRFLPGFLSRFFFSMDCACCGSCRCRRILCLVMVSILSPRKERGNTLMCPIRAGNSWSAFLFRSFLMSLAYDWLSYRRDLHRSDFAVDFELLFCCRRSPDLSLVGLATFGPISLILAPAESLAVCRLR